MFSTPPPLDGLDDFRAAAERRGIIVRREYMPETPRAHGLEVREYGDDDAVAEFYPAYWQIVLCKEEKRADGRIHAYFMTVDDRTLSFPTAWEHHFELLEMGWERYLQENA